MCAPTVMDPGSTNACGSRLPRARVQPPPSLAACLLSPADKLYNTSAFERQPGLHPVGQTLGAPHQPSWAAASCFTWEGDGDRVLCTALVLGMGSWAAIWTRRQSRSGGEKPTCTPCPHLLLAGLPALLPVPWPGLRVPMPTSRCPVWGAGRWPALQRRRRSLLSAATKEPKGGRRYGSKHGQGEARKVGNGRHLPWGYPCPSQ